jgi:flagellar basal-body rod modification protein FlgD
MDLSFTMAAGDKARTQVQVDTINAALKNERLASNELDKDDFLKILLTQLTHQDPTQPMEDKEFIAQMAQFSTLEQMTNMSKEFSALSGLLTQNQAISLIGKTVEVAMGEKRIEGMVEEISGHDYPQLLIGGRYYDLADVTKIRN